jgi:hypothetical protein
VYSGPSSQYAATPQQDSPLPPQARPPIPSYASYFSTPPQPQKPIQLPFIPSYGPTEPSGFQYEQSVASMPASHLSSLSSSSDQSRTFSQYQSFADPVLPIAWDKPAYNDYDEALRALMGSNAYAAQDWPDYSA